MTAPIKLTPSELAVGDLVVGQLISNNDLWINGKVEYVADGMVEFSSISGRTHCLPRHRVRRRVMIFRPPAPMPDLTPKPMYRIEKVDDKKLLSIVTYCCQNGEDEEVRRLGFTAIKLPDNTIMAFRRIKMGPSDGIPCKITQPTSLDTNVIANCLVYLGCKNFKVTGIGEVTAFLPCCQIPALRLIWDIKYDETEYQTEETPAGI